VVITATIGLAAQSSSSEGFSVSYLDRSVDACTDFYQFACGKWLIANPVPADRARYSRLNELADRNARIVRDILENAAFTTSSRTPDEQKIGDAYAACMDQKTIEARRATPLEPLLREIDAIKNRAQLIRLAARFSHDGFPSFLTLGSSPDAHDSSVFVAVLGQGAMGLPDRDLYLNDDERSTMLRRQLCSSRPRFSTSSPVSRPRSSAVATCCSAAKRPNRRPSRSFSACAAVGRHSLPGLFPAHYP